MESQGNILENIFDFFHLVKIFETYISAATVRGVLTESVTESGRCWIEGHNQ